MEWVKANPWKYTIIVILFTFFVLTVPLTIIMVKVREAWQKRELPAGKGAGADNIAAQVKA